MKKWITACCIFLIAAAATAQSADSNGIKRQVLISTRSAIITDTGSRIYDSVTTPATFPGGKAAWVKFLGHNLRYPAAAIQQKIEGSVVLQFVVGTDGTIRNLKAVRGPLELQEAAINAFKNTPNWIPAVKNGQPVQYTCRQAITFRMPQ